MPSPTSAPSPSGRRAQPVEFDDFYLAVRRRLLLQCLALTGDLTASRSAVRDAFVTARHHWRKVSRLAEPEDWVRPRAWSIAQRRSVARIWHREKGLTDQQTAVLDALSKLSDVQRKTILLTHLAALPLDGIGRELGQTRAATEQHLQQTTAALARALECDSALIRAQLESLAPLVASPGLPRVTVIRRNGARRQRWHAAGGSLLAVVLAVGAGWFVTAGSTGGGPSHRQGAAARPVTEAMLLTAAQVRPVAPKQSWTITDTGDNTAGTGLNTVCQRARFADERGLGTWVRKLRSSGSPAQQVVQTVEVSASPGAATSTYRTTLGWYAGCTAARVQLERAYRVDGLGEHAEALRLRLAGAHQRTYLVVVAGTGSVTTTTVLSTPGATSGSKSASKTGARAGALDGILSAASAGMRNLCRSSAITDCPTGSATAVAVLPPPSGEVAGMLATADLPPIPGIDEPWVGTDPVTGGPNLAATTCDRADFLEAGAKARSRTFLIPEAHLPQRFGITETTGDFPSTRAAKKFVAVVRARMDSCEKRQLGSHLSHHVERPHGPRGSTYSMWRQTAEINSRKATVSYWMGVARVGKHVAQVNFTPSGGDDIDAATFRDLVARARDRLFEDTGATP